MTIDTTGLSGRRARAFADYLLALDSPYAVLVAASEAHDFGRIQVDIAVETPQDAVVPLQPIERIEIGFSGDDAIEPRFWAAREDFPLHLTHTSLPTDGGKPNLCVWEIGWAELRRSLTPEDLLLRIQQWLNRTARGDLHDPAQGLEPLLPATSDTLILPAGGLPTGSTPKIGKVRQVGGRWLVDLGLDDVDPAADPRFGTLFITLPPAVHGSLNQMPQTLAALADLIHRYGGDLVPTLSVVLQDRFATSQAGQIRLLLIVLIPKKAEADAEATEFEVWAFLSEDTVLAIGEALGVFIADGQTARLRVGGAPTDLAAFKISPWRIVHRLSRAAAARLSGHELDDRRIVAVGAGAIASNLATVAVRQAFGRWTFIDDDAVLPHNTVRHGQGDWAVGNAKVSTLQAILENTLAESSVDEAIVADFLSPGAGAAAIEAAVSTADLLVDLSASPAVLGRLTDVPSAARRISLFFNPVGSDLVLLSEDAQRLHRLDALEAEYLAAAAIRPAMDGHFDQGRESFVRYGNACRDLSRPLPPWKVALLSAIGAEQLQRAAGRDDASAMVWRLDDDGAVTRIDLDVSHNPWSAGETWRLTVSGRCREQMRRWRAEALPSETGGVLMGVVDHQRRTMHVSLVLPAPPDSKQSPTYFERGSSGLKAAVGRIRARTAHQLDYIGEWHSHPDGAAARPSADDDTVFAFLREGLGRAGRPYLMMIVGQYETFARFAMGDAPPEDAVFRA